MTVYEIRKSERVGCMSKIISKGFQETMLVQIALQRKTRIELSREVGLSEFTLRKVLDSPTPVEVSGRTFHAVSSWLEKYN